MNQNEAKQINATHNQQPRFETNCSFLTISLTGQLLAIPLLTERLHLLWYFEDEFQFLSIYKSSR